MDYEIQRHMPRKVIFDFNRVILMDRAGIGMIIGRYKLTSMLGGTLEICNIKPNIKKVLEMSGIHKIIKLYEEEEEETNAKYIWKWNEIRILKQVQ